MERYSTIETEIENLKDVDNKVFLQKVIKNKLDMHTIAYFAYDDLSNNPYRQNISKAVLYNKELKARTAQTLFMMISAIASLISTIIALITVLAK